MQRWIVGIIGIACGLVLVARGWADADKRRQLREQIDSLLSSIASELRDVPGDSSASDLDRTSDYESQVADKARSLKDIAEGDSDANRIGGSYPDYARKYQEAARSLRELKLQHRRIDEWPKRCEAARRRGRPLTRCATSWSRSSSIAT